MAAWLVTLTCSAGAAAAYGDGYRINVTGSVPVGLWQEQRGAIVRGAIVSFCPPDTAIFRQARARDYLPPGVCPGDFRPMFKPVVAVAGDAVTVSRHGIAVNGHTLANTAQIGRDAAGRALPLVPPGRYLVRPGEIWLVSSYNRASFDGRYFGPMNLSQVQALVRPVLVAMVRR